MRIFSIELSCYRRIDAIPIKRRFVWPTEFVVINAKVLSLSGITSDVRE
jgi:hypothetical protein